MSCLRAIGLAACLPALVLSCGTRSNPDVCDPSANPCKGGSVCDPKTRRCRPPDAGQGADAAGMDARADTRLADADEIPDSGAETRPDATPDVAADATPDAVPDLRPPDLLPDAPPPDAPGTCGSAQDCRTAGAPYCAGGRCVACLLDAQCTLDRPICLANTCVICNQAAPDACMRRGVAAPVCDMGTGRCVECTTGNHCGDPARPMCSAGRCVACAADAHCADPAKPICSSSVCAACQAAPAGSCARRDPKLPACDAASGRCLECTAATACTDPVRRMCVSSKCVECTADAQCPDARPICVQNACLACADAAVAADACPRKNLARPFCDRTSGQCTPCVSRPDPEAACAQQFPSLPHCDPGGRCVDCRTTSDCNRDIARPICESNQCVRCARDSQCAATYPGSPGVCMSHQDGRCATDAETVYVQNLGAGMCSDTMGTGGTLTLPLCSAQLGVDSALGSGKRLVILRGPETLFGFRASPTGAQLSVVGQNAAEIDAGASVGVELASGDLYVRSVRIRNSDTYGVRTSNDTTIRLDRCTIERNMTGALEAFGGFDITNTIFAQNGGVNSISLYGQAGRPQRFMNNTIVGSTTGAGLYCNGPYQMKNLLMYNSPYQDYAGCVLSSSKVSTDGAPYLSPTWRLTMMSPCRNAGDPTDFTPDDIDGEARPKEGRSDCGADEY